MDGLCNRHQARFRGRPQTAGSGTRAHLLNNLLAGRRAVLKENRCFAVSALNGTMTPAGPDGHGLWLGDTRWLSEFRLLVNGREPHPIALHGEAGSLVFELAAGDLQVLRERYVDQGLHERITITNRGSSAVRGDLAMEFGSDFAAMFAVRGIVRDLPPSQAKAPDIVIRPPGRRHDIDLDPN